MNRILSAIICAVCVFLAKKNAGAEGVINLFFWMPWPMALIWFGDELGSAMGFDMMHPVNAETPGKVVRIFGWLGLLTILGIILYRGSLVVG